MLAARGLLIARHEAIYAAYSGERELEAGGDELLEKGAVLDVRHPCGPFPSDSVQARESLRAV
ncbi:MAG TPA: hypothetical protein VE359_14405 [Vicinamibacteria bacterium]|nr:hypothetical protein [Vicinamibacteria bacterium]